MLKFKKIINTILIFIVSMLIICFLFSLYKVFTNQIPASDIISETGLYFLYTIGYGALEGDSTIQNILAMVGIVSIALMTTFLTINLFWRLDDVKFNKNILYDKNFLKMQFRNSGRAICDMKVTFVLYDEVAFENIGKPKEYYMPILLKNAKWTLKLGLNETFWYKTVYNLLFSKDKKLYCVFSFVDTKTGQGSIKVEQITKENLKAPTELFDYKEFTKPKILSNKKLLPIENKGHLHLETAENNVVMNFSFDKVSDDNDFVMAYYNLHDPFLNLEKYNREKTYIELNLESENDIKLTFEIKLSNTNIITIPIEINNEAKIVKIELKDIPNNLEEVREICYTIFRRDNNLTGSLQIGNLRIING